MWLLVRFDSMRPKRENNMVFQLSRFTILTVLVAVVALAGCVGRTGKVGVPIAAKYGNQLAMLKVGASTQDDLKDCFKKQKISIKETKVENGKTVEIWELAKGGDMDAAAFIMWGYVSYDKDQSLLFRFEDGKLTGYESVVHPDPVKSK